MVKGLPLKLKQCFSPFTILPVKGSSETVLFRHLSNHVFGSPEFCKYRSYEGDFCFNCSIFDVNFENVEEDSKKKISF